ncbi:hypothetical protein B0H14DRAFT_2642323 [Mycena olivaceomarginata]|nr:hypothetical protein B0H14DRAFT_2642323 [Mycena olivaceomarginata]
MTVIVWDAIKNRMDEALERVRSALDDGEDASDIIANTFLAEVTQDQLDRVGMGFLARRHRGTTAARHHSRPSTICIVPQAYENDVDEHIWDENTAARTWRKLVQIKLTLLPLRRGILLAFTPCIPMTTHPAETQAWAMSPVTTHGAGLQVSAHLQGSRVLLSAKMGVKPTHCRRAPYALAVRGCTSTGTTASADGGDVTDPSTFELRLIPFGLRPGEGRIDVGVASSWNTGAAGAACGPALRRTVCVWVWL